MLNQLEYCERRFYLMHVLGEMDINAHVLEGTLRHEQAHTGTSGKEGEVLVHRRVYVWSDALEVAGFADIVEEAKGDHPGLTPLEYKKGRMGRWLNDHIQLCAQAICLEERLGKTIERGYIFYFGSRRRQEVIFSPELRQQTRAAVGRARQLIAAAQLPPPLATYAKCRDCSLEPICLPRESRQLAPKGIEDHLTTRLRDEPTR
jgi:CRISPR-associated exonuclease Cas4